MSPFGIQVTEHFTFILLTGLCVDLVVQLERLKGTYELVHVLRLLAAAHFSRFLQLTMAENNVPPMDYLRKVLLFYDLPITANVAAFYIIFHIFSKSPDVVLCFALNLVIYILMFMSKRMEVEECISRIEDASLQDMLVNLQRYYAANNPITYLSDFSQGDYAPFDETYEFLDFHNLLRSEYCRRRFLPHGFPTVHGPLRLVRAYHEVQKREASVSHSQSETEDPIDIKIKITNHFAIILLTALCVDLVVQVGKLRGTYELENMLRLLTTAHICRFMQLRRKGNNVPLVYYLRKVLPFYDLPITVAIVAFYVTFRTCRKTLALEHCLAFNATASMFILIKKCMKRHEDILSALSLCDDQLLHPPNYDAANNPISTTPNFSQLETEHPNGAGEIRAVSSVNTELVHQHNYDAPHSTSSPTNFRQRQIWDPPTGDHVFASIHVASNRVTRDLSAIKEKDDVAPDSISENTNFSRWEKGESIGSGGFGTVYVAQNREIRDLCAVKKLKNIHRLEHVESIKKEIKILSQLEHPNIVKYYGHEIVGCHISLCMEYIQPGSLKKYILKRGVLQKPLIQNFTTQILSGLVYLHSKRVVHRDIKPDNLLVDSDDNVKLVDFGLAKHLAESMGKHSKLATPYYAAPEVLKNIEYKSSREASAADIWSLGCVIIEMFLGKHPWPGLEPVQAFYKVCVKEQHPPIPEELCAEGKDFLKLCFTITPAKRPHAAALLHHPFLKPQTT